MLLVRFPCTYKSSYTEQRHRETICRVCYYIALLFVMITEYMFHTAAVILFDNLMITISWIWRNRKETEEISGNVITSLIAMCD